MGNVVKKWWVSESRMGLGWVEKVSVLETTLGMPDWDGLDMYGGGTDNIWEEGCSRWSYKVRGKDKIRGCGERGSADSMYERRKCRARGKIEEDNSLSRLLEKVRCSSWDQPDATESQSFPLAGLVTANQPIHTAWWCTVYCKSVLITDREIVHLKSNNLIQYSHPTC